MRKSKIVAFDPGSVSLKGGAPTTCKRPPLAMGAALEEKIRWAETRAPRLPILEEAKAREVLGELAVAGELPQWQRMLAQFPVAGVRLVAGILDSQQSDELSPALQSKLNWVIARQDGAWYLTALARRELTSHGVDAKAIDALDASSKDGKEISDPRERELILVAKNLAASPIVLTDAQVARAVEIAGPRAVTQVIHYTCYRAALNRMTEGAGLCAE